MERTHIRSEQTWQAFNRGAVIISLGLALILIVLWLAGYTPNSQHCCRAENGEAVVTAHATRPEPITVSTQNASEPKSTLVE